MTRDNAIHCIKFLNEVPIKGHEARQVMNAVCEELLEMINTEDKQAEPDGKTDTE